LPNILKNRAKTSRSRVESSFWTHDTPQGALERIAQELESRGYLRSAVEPDQQPNRHARFADAKQSILTSLRRPVEVAVECYDEEERTRLVVSARCHPVLERLSTPALVLVNAFVLLGLPALALLPEQMGEKLGEPYIVFLCAVLLVATVLYPVGFVTFASYMAAIARWSHSAFEGAAYPLHYLREVGKSAPFGTRWDTAFAIVLFPFGLLSILFLALVPEQFGWGTGATLLLVFGVLLRLLGDRKRRPAITALQRHLVAICAVVTYLFLGWGAQLRMGISYQEGGEFTWTGSVVWGALMATLGFFLLAGWSVAQRSTRDMSTAMHRGEFVEHVGETHHWGYPIMTWALVLLSSVGLWSGVCMIAGGFGVLPAVCFDWQPVSSFVSGYLSLPVHWQFVSFALVGLLISMRVVSCIALARSAHARKNNTVRGFTCPEDAAAMLQRARAASSLPLRLERSDSDPHAAYSYLAGWLATKHVVVVGSAIAEGALHRHCRAILAHELAHCILGHHQRTRRLRILGMVLLLDPVVLTSIQDHSKNEEDADGLAVQLLGGDLRAREEMITALQHMERVRSRQDSRLALGALREGTAFRETARPDSENPRPWGTGMVAEAVRGVASYLLSARVLYLHPAVDRRIAALKQLVLD